MQLKEGRFKGQFDSVNKKVDKLIHYYFLFLVYLL